MKTTLAMLYLMMLPFYTYSKEDPPALPKKMMISHVEHYGIQPFKELIKQTYDDLGIPTQFYAVPNTRGFKTLNDSFFDADVVRIGNNTKPYDNIILVQPKLYDAELVLLCQKGIVCNRDILQNQATVVLASRGNHLEQLISEIQAQIITIDNNIETLEMLRKNRMQYLIYATTSYSRIKIEKEFDVVTLHKVALYHILNKKHESLLPLIEASLMKHLKSFDPGQGIGSLPINPAI